VIRAWVVCDGAARECSPREAAANAAAGTGTAWIDVEGEDLPAMEVFAPLQIHPLVLEDMVVELNRPKVDNYGRYLYLVVHSARWEEGERPSLRELDMVLGDRFLITYHEAPTRSITDAHDVLPRRPRSRSGAARARGAAQARHVGVAPDRRPAARHGPGADP
jgi:Mg2+ and Co2+ transporter CorA